MELAIICSVLASIGYSGSLVFYDAFLPEIASEDQFDQVSAKGYSLGYIGSVILLIANLIVISFSDEIFPLESYAQDLMSTVNLPFDTAMQQAAGYYKGLASRISFLAVGLWWIGFSQITFKRVPEAPPLGKTDENIWTEGYKELRKVWNSLGNLKVMKLYLLAFFFYNMGVQTVMYLAAIFGSKELKLESAALIMTVLIINLVAIGGAYGFAYLSKMKGNKLSLLVMVFIWVLICLGAYFVHTANEFYVLAFVVGLVMGGIQALSRATFAKLIPSESPDHASFFSFYDVTYNLSIVVGTFSYGLINQITGTMRNSVLALILFFVVGLGFLVLAKLPVKKEIKSA